jgi:hypothetical protein
MAPPPIMKTNLVVDLLSSRSPPQSTSQYPSTSLDGVAPNCNFTSKLVGGKMSHTTITQVLDVPKMKNNLISVSKFTSEGFKVEFD